MGSSSSKPEIPDNLPNPETGWIATEFKEYNEKFVVVNTYKTLDRLGRGGFGTVYKVQQTSTEKIYALKYSKEYDVATKEAAIMMGLQHTSIAKIHRYFPLYDNKRVPIGLCIIMDFVEGENLRELLRRQHYPAERISVMKWFISILQALSYLHEKKIIHRDIKPENIIVRQNIDYSYSVILVDFGIARQQLQDNEMATVSGTLAYISPELLIASGPRAPLSAKADIWALGCVLYETWTKDLATVASMGIIQKIAFDTNFFRKLDDPSIELILPKMLDGNPDRRISAKELLNSDIIKAWTIAIDPKHPDFNKVPKDTVYSLPHISILKDKEASLLSRLGTVLFLIGCLDGYFDTILVNQHVPLCLLNLLNKHVGEKDADLLHSNCRLLLRALLSGAYSDVVAYQICSHMRGIENLFSSVSNGTITLLCAVPFGFRTLERLGLQRYVRKLLQMEKVAMSGALIYAALPTTTIPLERFLSALVKENSIDKQATQIAELLTRHTDLSVLLKSREAHTQLSALLGTMIYPGLSKSLLLSLVHALIPSQQNVIVECVNHRHCTTTVFGTNYVVQTVFLCLKCTVVACLACVKTCHRSCTGQFFTGLVTCRCATKKDGNCIASLTGQAKPDTATDLQFHSIGDTELLPPPEDNYSWQSSLRYIEASHEALAPHCLEDSYATTPFQHCRSKGFFLPPQSSDPIHAVFYFEVDILFPAVGATATICVGVSQMDFPPKEKLELGVTASHGWGYYGDTGGKVTGSKPNPLSQSRVGPPYSTGDRVGCGVLSDGAVFYTLNGMYLGSDAEDARIPTNCQVFSTIFVAGYSAHVRFIFDRQSFLFAPSNAFEPQTYLKNLPQTFTNVELLQNAFGPDVNKILDALNKTSASVDLIAPVIVALLPHYPNFEDILRSHPIYLKLVVVTTPYAKALLENNLQLAPPTLPEERPSLLAQQRFGTVPTINNSPVVIPLFNSSPALSPKQVPSTTVSAEMIDQLIETRMKEKLKQSLSFSSSSFIVLRVVIDGLPDEEEFEVVLHSNKLTKDGLIEALVELRDSLDKDKLGKTVGKIMKENKIDNNTVKQTRMPLTDANVQVLKNNDKLIVSFK